MKVLQVIASTSRLRGGTSTAVDNFATALQRRGIHTDTVTTDDDGPGHLPVSLGKFFETSTGRLIYFRRQTKFYSTSLPMLNWLWRHAPEYDLIHAHGLFNFAPVAAALSARLAGRPYILTPHGTLDQWGRQNRRRRFKRLSIALLDSHLIRSAAAVHFTSELECSQARQLNFSFRSCIIPLGMELTQFSELATAPRPAGLAAAIGVNPTILFLSRIDFKKGLDVLLDAFCRVLAVLPTALLAVAGDGEAELVQILKQRTEQLGIANSVHWLGFVSGEKKHWLLRHCSLFALPSQSENFGLAVVEAMAAGLPVIVSPGVALAELIERGGAGAVCNATPGDLASTLIAWLKDAQRLTAAGCAGQLLAYKEMSLDTFGRRLEDLYVTTLTAGSTSITARQAAK